MQPEFDQVREDRAHADTFDKFTVLVAMGGVHVAIMLSALGLAFIAKLPLLAIAWGVAAHIGLAVGVMRAWARPPAPSLPGVLPETAGGRGSSVHVLHPTGRS
ncbi:MAG: hypothetical protein FD144_3205 [Rhodospirillaceae bacterium]|nr:MAG: hypothetical protein FD144_3205 [Rhodospirillaceae bacterium]